MTHKFIHHATKKPIPVIHNMSGVESSQIKQTGYDPDTKTLAVQFKYGKGAVYHYSGVTQEQFDAFKASKSPGTHFGQHFKTLPFEKYVPAAE